MGSLLQFVPLSGLLLALWGSGVLTPSLTQEAAAQQTVWLSLESREASSEGEESAMVQVSAANVVNLGAAQFEILFPSEAWEFSQATAGTLLSSALLESNLIEPGRIKVAFVSSESIDGAGTLLTLEFKPISTSGIPTGVELQNFRAWKQEDSADSEFLVGPTDRAETPAPEPPPSTPVETTPATLANPEPLPSLAPPVVVNVPPTQLNFPESLQLKIEIPGSVWFLAGTLCGLLAAGLIGWIFKTK